MAQQRFQRTAQGQPKTISPKEQAQGLGHADIPAADAEGQVSPGVQHGPNEETVAEDGEPGPQEPQQFVNRPQSHAQQTGGGKLAGGDRYPVHLNRRLAQPPRCRGSS